MIVTAIIAHVLLTSLITQNVIWLFRVIQFSIISFIFFFLIYGVDFQRMSLARDFDFAAIVWLRVVLLITTFLASRRLCKKRSLFAFMIVAGLPTGIMYLLFQAFALVDRFSDKGRSVITGLQLRGLRVTGPVSRLIALTEAFAAMFNGVVLEIDQRDIAHECHGYHLSRNIRTSPDVLRLKWCDFWYIMGWSLAVVTSQWL